MAEKSSIDVTELVEELRSSFVSWATAHIFYILASSPSTAWLALPVIAPIVRGLIEWIFNRISKTVEMEIFFLNTAMRKAEQATDYLAARRAKELAGGEDEYAELERKEITAFVNFVRLRN